jgi:hypothetical protein
METLPREAIKVAPAVRHVRSLPGNWFMLREAAHELGVSDYVLRKFIAEDTPGLQPSKYTMFGKVKVYLYSRADVTRIAKHLATRAVVYPHDGQAKRFGRPPKYDAEERKWRDRLHSRRWYWMNRVQALTEKGDEKGVAKAKAKIRAIDRELKKK